MYTKNIIFKNYNSFIASIWIIIILTLWIQVMSGCPVWRAALYVLFFAISAFIVTTFLSRVLLPKALKDHAMGKFVLYFIILTLFLSFVLALITQGFYYLEQNGYFVMSTLISATHNPFYWEIVSMIPTALLANFGFCGLRFYYEHNQILQRNAQLERAHHEDQLFLLKDQINPHFMFNVMNHIHVLMKKDVELADELLFQFSDIFRYQLYECDHKNVFLEKEVQYLKDVIDIEKMRWGTELKVTCSWKVEDGKKEISPFLLISFVENAFKHVGRLPAENGYINIALSQQNSSLNLVVENSIGRFQERQKNKNSGIGLQNATQRLNLLYAGKHRLEINETDTAYRVQLQLTL